MVGVRCGFEILSETLAPLLCYLVYSARLVVASVTFWDPFVLDWCGVGFQSSSESSPDALCVGDETKFLRGEKSDCWLFRGSAFLAEATSHPKLAFNEHFVRQVLISG